MKPLLAELHLQVRRQRGELPQLRDQSGRKKAAEWAALFATWADEPDEDEDEAPEQANR